MIKLKLFCAAALFAASGAHAAVIDFENESPLNPDPTLIAVGNSYINGAITFSSTEVMKLVGTGGDTDGFVPNDNPGNIAGGTTPAEFDDVFLTGDFIDNTDMTLSFSAVDSITFQIVDIDGGGNNTEVFKFEAFNSGTSVGSQTITGAGAPDAQVDIVSFAAIGPFDMIEITGTTQNGTRNIGWGIDNIVLGSPSAPPPVPLPAAGVMLLTALGGIAALRRRKKAA